jgi:hypothetical protein
MVVYRSIPRREIGTAHFSGSSLPAPPPLQKPVHSFSAFFFPFPSITYKEKLDRPARRPAKLKPKLEFYANTSLAQHH